MKEKYRDKGMYSRHFKCKVCGISHLWMWQTVLLGFVVVWGVQECGSFVTVYLMISFYMDNYEKLELIVHITKSPNFQQGSIY
jgi:phage shock protein PspC (stress-responsive transcriptional regulator)